MIYSNLHLGRDEVETKKFYLSAFIMASVVHKTKALKLALFPETAMLLFR